MTIQKQAQAMTEALTARTACEADREIAEEVAHQLAEMHEVAGLYKGTFDRLAALGSDAADSEVVRLLDEARALIFERAIIHAKDLRRPLEELADSMDGSSAGT